MSDCFLLSQQLVSSARDKKPRGRYAKLEEEMERGNEDFIDQQRNQQQVRISSGGCVCGCRRPCCHIIKDIIPRFL